MCLESTGTGQYLSHLYNLTHAMFHCLCPQEEFLSLCADKLTEIIASDHLNVPKEETVFEAAILWLEKCSTPIQSFEKVSLVQVIRMTFLVCLFALL